MRYAGAALALSLLVFAPLSQAQAASCSNTGCLTIRLQGDTGTLNTDSILLGNVGDTITLDLVVDTGGLSFEGYGFDVAFSPSGMVTNIVFVHETVTDGSASLVPNLLFGPFVVGTDGVSNVNQGTAGTGLAPDVYTVDTISFDLTQLGTVSVAASFNPTLDSFGLGGGAVTDIGFFHTTINVVPEPSTGLLLSMGLAALAWDGRRRGRQARSTADAER